MNAQSLLLIGIITMNLLAALFVFQNNPKSATNRLYGILSVTISFWLVVLYLSLEQALSEHYLYFARLSIFLATPMNFFFFLLARTLPAVELSLSKKWFWSGIVFTLLVMAISISPLAFTGVRILDGALKVIPGIGMIPFALHAFISTVLAGYALVTKIRNAKRRAEQQQLWFFMLGIVIMLSLLFFTVLIPVLFFNNDSTVILAPLYTLIFLLLTGYSIVKHGLLDIRFILARAVAFLIFLLFFAAVYALVTILIFQEIFAVSMETPLFIGLFVFLAGAMLLFQPLQELLRRLTDRFFFKWQYDGDVLLSDLTRIMVTSLDLDTITQKILEILLREMRITKGAFLVLDGHRITESKSIGYDNSSLASQELESLFHQHRATADHFAFEDLSEGPLKDLFRRLDIMFAVPIKVENVEVAILILGPKLSGEIYYDRDVNVLKIFASESGIAIQNAEAYTQIKRFSEKLEKRVEERTSDLKESQKRELAEAREVARLKDEFVFLATHELRTPITAIRGFLELTSEASENFPKDVKENFLAISQASNHLNQLVNDLLEIARSESGALTINVSPENLLPIVEGVLHEVASLIKQKEILLQTNFRQIPLVSCDAAKVKEVLTNLIGNAVKYNREKGTIAINIFRHPNENTVMFEIRDNGYGIPKDQQEKIFQKFFRAKTKGTQEVLGTGLGLFLTRVLVEKMGGQISFSSVEQQGTTFTFSLPVAAV